MVGPLPWGLLVLLREDFSPLLGVPIKQMYRVKSFFVWGAASVKDDPVIFLVVAH